MEDGKDHSTSTPRSGAHRPWPAISPTGGKSPGRLNTQAWGGTTFYSEKGGERQQYQPLCVHWSSMARGSLMIACAKWRTSPIPLLLWRPGSLPSMGVDDILLVGVIDAKKQCKEIYWIPRSGESFLLTRKKNLGPGNSLVPSFHIGEWFRPRMLAGWTQRGVVNPVMSPCPTDGIKEMESSRRGMFVIPLLTCLVLDFPIVSLP